VILLSLEIAQPVVRSWHDLCSFVYHVPIKQVWIPDWFSCAASGQEKAAANQERSPFKPVLRFPIQIPAARSSKWSEIDNDLGGS
jgi:hypothetical protein